MDAVSGHSQHQPRYCKVTVTFARQFRASYDALCNPLRPGSSAAAKCWAERHVESPQIATPNLGCAHLYTRNASPGSLCLAKRRSAAACFKSSSSRSRAVYFTWQPVAATVALLCLYAYVTMPCRPRSLSAKPVKSPTALTEYLGCATCDSSVASCPRHGAVSNRILATVPAPRSRMEICCPEAAG